VGFEGQRGPAEYGATAAAANVVFERGEHSSRLHFNAGLWKFGEISVTSYGIPGFPVSIEMAQQCTGFFGLN
jgi:hypothetical protein